MNKIENFIEKVVTIQPSSNYAFAWEIFHVIFVIANLIVIPIEVCFQQYNLLGDVFKVINVIVYCLNSIFLINTAYYESKILLF